MITQYTDSYSSCPADIQNIVANDISLMEHYILVQTGQYEWTALIQTVGTQKTRELVFKRQSNNYNSIYTVERVDNSTFEATIENEYYVFSNVGYGKSLDLPVYEGATSWAVMTMCCIVMFWVVFREGLFKCLRWKR